MDFPIEINFNYNIRHYDRPYIEIPVSFLSISRSIWKNRKLFSIVLYKSVFWLSQ